MFLKIKKFYYNDKLKVSLCFNKKYFMFFFFNEESKIIYKLYFNGNFLLKNNKLHFFNNNLKLLSNFYGIFYCFYDAWIKSNLNIYRYYIRLNLIGLGYKNFIIKEKLYLLLGDSHYFVLPLKKDIRVFCRKRHIYILGFTKNSVSSLVKIISSLKKINFYKGKGIIPFKNFKFMKLKTGKKQRFM